MLEEKVKSAASSSVTITVAGSTTADYGRRAREEPKK